ncbi:Bifunctional inhibitor/plant lipid transfer protein/seed storage helical domain [Sesbania bispinosa]|nr:Bifunctional inhibitor/plant lipid transfer protein/seed storage helical domain [Sesbania bispinosa]
MGKRTNTYLMILVIIGVSMLFGMKNVEGLCDDADLKHLVAECHLYIERSMPQTDPSKDCCAVVKKVNFPCVCLNLTKKMKELLDMQKIIYVAKFCVNPNPPGTKCGEV